MDETIAFAYLAINLNGFVKGVTVDGELHLLNLAVPRPARPIPADASHTTAVVEMVANAVLRVKSIFGNDFIVEAVV